MGCNPNQAYFNPRTHEECDKDNLTGEQIEYTFQSTHSRGVRRYIRVVEWCSIRFQSTHSRGVRLSVAYALISPFYFNPRTHEECDRSSPILLSMRIYFNPRTHEECDHNFIFKRHVRILFQSTHSRGVRRPYTCSTSIPTLYFNPRTHEECDFIAFIIDEHFPISIHALTRSATATCRQC